MVNELMLVYACVLGVSGVLVWWGIFGWPIAVIVFHISPLLSNTPVRLLEAWEYSS